ncbi:Cofilin [Trichoplax sp. H2]|uniref:ADF-H domain-containing protein n=1 Tax=Trichoplax adhaerens TaxID=10228 RepID=B3S0K8_TRIAD|nr:hypothetical protein TRIADDRAFT_57086 [Trichoplax adhaerens]EDV24028.1 hypothetical protein TRIADDRAFT_57086 [Trichoplax adhaerens]RDD44844.1 Cofilin [Trichoplax sp. H2]|eukprot:XP_002113554.1 hypothetical protein TRIADDRAFT_57086 [Trichoplax adhaerens]
MTSGVTLGENVLSTYDDCQLRHKYKFILFKLNDNKTQIVVEDAVTEGSYEDLLARLPEDDGRFAVYDFQYFTADGGERNKLVLIAWVPDTAKIKVKMVYASSKENLKKELNGIHLHVQATDKDELDKDDILSKLSAGGSK